MSIPIEHLTTFRSTVYLGLGSNLEEPTLQIARALRELDDLTGVALVKVSSFYRTAPIGLIDQPPFTNAVAQVETTLAPLDLMRALLDIERRHDRIRAVKNGPRTLDLDILIFNEWRLDEPELTTPHPRLHRRAFALVPLLELNADIYIPGKGFAKDFLAEVASHGVEKLDLAVRW